MTPMMITIFAAFIMEMSIEQMGFTGYMTGLLSKTIPAGLIPVTAFLAAGGITFFAASFWALIVIAFPIFLPMAVQAGVNPALLAFLDTDDFEEKYKILCGLEQRGEVTNHLIDQFAVTLDLVIPEGDADDRFVQLKNCVRTRSHFETNRLR